MAPGGSIYQDISESCVTSPGYDIGTANVEYRGSPLHKSNTVNVKGAMASNSAMHDLLDCLVCWNSMYPPIYQVLPLAQQHFSPRKQRELLYQSLCVMPMRLIECILCNEEEIEQERNGKIASFKVWFPQLQSDPNCASQFMQAEDYFKRITHKG